MLWWHLGFSQPSWMLSGSHAHNTWPRSLHSSIPSTRDFLTGSTLGSHSRASDAQTLKTISSWCNNEITKWQLELVPLRWSPEQRNLWYFIPGGTTGAWALFVQGISSSQPPAWALLPGLNPQPALQLHPELSAPKHSAAVTKTRPFFRAHTQQNLPSKSLKLETTGLMYTLPRMLIPPKNRDPVLNLKET